MGEKIIKQTLYSPPRSEQYWVLQIAHRKRTLKTRISKSFAPKYLNFAYFPFINLVLLTSVRKGNKNNLESIFFFYLFTCSIENRATEPYAVYKMSHHLPYSEFLEFLIWKIKWGLGCLNSLEKMKSMALLGPVRSSWGRFSHPPGAYPSGSVIPVPLLKSRILHALFLLSTGILN